MPQQYLAFDIETAKDVPGDAFNWRPHRPLGISCAATLESGSGKLRTWFGKTKEGTPDKQMRQAEAQALVQFLSNMAADGFRILTWNGLGFDFDILAEESGEVDRCKECALGHVDLMFHVFCTLGFPVALDKAAQGMNIPGKPPGMSGIKAPILWAQGRYDEVLDYVAQDVRAALGIAQSGEQHRIFEWITRKGTKSSMPLARGWLTVREALQLPDPDTSWMSSPLSRRDFISWMSDV